MLSVRCKLRSQGHAALASVHCQCANDWLLGACDAILLLLAASSGLTGTGQVGLVCMAVKVCPVGAVHAHWEVLLRVSVLLAGMSSSALMLCLPREVVMVISAIYVSS